MLYALYKPDGSIHNSSKIFAPKRQRLAWEEQLREHGENFITTDERAGLLPPDRFYVHVDSLAVRERPVMDNIRIDKTRIKCDDADVSIASGIPRGARILVAMLDGTVLEDKAADGPTLEITLPVECSLRITLSKWPYQDFRYLVEGVLNP